MRFGLLLLCAVLACASCARGSSVRAAAPNAVGSTMFDDRYLGSTPSPWQAPAVAEETKGGLVEENHDGIVIVTSRR